MGADARTGNGWRPLSASELQQMTGRAGRRGRDNVGLWSPLPVYIRIRNVIAQLLHASPDPLVSQFRATYTTLLNLALTAYGSFAGVREIAGRSFAYRDLNHQINQLRRLLSQSEQTIHDRLAKAWLQSSSHNCAWVCRTTGRCTREAP